MSILIDENTRLMVQGITGREGSFHASRCKAYGTNLVCGVTPGRGGAMFEETVPVYNTVEQAVAETGANASLIFVPPAFAADAIAESADAGISVIACITEGIPAIDVVRLVRYIRDKPVTLIGPNCPGIMSPGGRCKMGIMPPGIYLPGRVGVVSRSGTLTYEAVGQLTDLGIGQSTSVGIGGDPIVGTSFIEVLRMFQDDPDTDAVVMIGEIGGTREQEAAEFIASDFTKPVAALIVGQSAPPGRRMGHAGAIVTGAAARASEKTKALAAAGVTIVPSPGEIGSTVREVLAAR
jgi:succinyl-CoA synthetase alpha subunit